MTRLTSVGFALSGLIFAGAVQAGERKPPNLAGPLQQAYCMSGDTDYNDPNAYFSAVFKSVVEQSPGQSATDQSRSTAEWWTKSFTAFLADRHGFNGSADCYLMTSQSDIEWLAGRLHGLVLHPGPGHRIETGCVYKQ